MTSPQKKTVAVVFGGRSPEHDVSVSTGLAVLHNMDRSKYNPLPVYIDTDGHWYTGQALWDVRNFIPTPALKRKLHHVSLDINPRKNPETLLAQGVLTKLKRGLFDSNPYFTFDLAFLALLGGVGENGSLAGVMETAEIPYAGARVRGASVFMDKVTTKIALEALDIPQLPYAVIPRKPGGVLLDNKSAKSILGSLAFPLIVKPVGLGSSIGVKRVDNLDELNAALPHIFQFDIAAIVEPYVDNLVEYNVAVTDAFGDTRCSVIEEPISTESILSFDQKYLAGGKCKGKFGKFGKLATKGYRTDATTLAKTRKFNPESLKDKEAKEIIDQVTKAFKAYGVKGAARADFLCDRKKGKLWLNEFNTLPGAMGHYLWEHSKPSVSFQDLITGLIDEGFLCHQQSQLPLDPVPAEARLFPRDYSVLLRA